MSESAITGVENGTAFTLQTTQVLECSTLYCTDDKMQKRKKQLGIENMNIIEPPEAVKRIEGPLLSNLEE